MEEKFGLHAAFDFNRDSLAYDLSSTFFHLLRNGIGRTQILNQKPKTFSLETTKVCKIFRIIAGLMTAKAIDAESRN
ncbi:hypothetical protein DLM78_15275 [Leptospira stimsonii]|uniref:Uncharacterized protein n=1 Tax=Leptospira stimsonii TaxID=2202203 RepID=A0A8B3CNG7_9LEPT|nr:hypothetical protein DLM78_15275 [Leptospira stimsonii]